MNRNDFDDKSPGKLVEITASWGKDCSFIPDPVPKDWEFSGDLWPLLAEVKQKLGMLEGIGRTLPNPGILLKPIADREAIRSSRLEGTYTTPQELLLYEFEQSEAKSAHDPLNAHREVLNYRLALEHGTESDLPLSLRLIKELHQLLMTGVRGKDRTPGEFRQIPVAIGTGGRFIPPPHENIISCLNRLEKDFHEQWSQDPLVSCFLCHYQFETIHPFTDGNGRVGRLLLAMMLQQKCELSKPWLYMSEYFEKHRDEYVQNLYHVSTKGDWSTWIEFCLLGTLHQARDTVVRCERLIKIRENFMAQTTKIGGSIRLSQIVEGLFHSPFVRIPDLAKKLKVTYPTAKKDIEQLAVAGILKELPNIHPKTYVAPIVFDVIFENMEEG